MYNCNSRGLYQSKQMVRMDKFKKTGAAVAAIEIFEKEMRRGNFYPYRARELPTHQYLCKIHNIFCEMAQLKLFVPGCARITDTFIR
jgi:hypothetical protein